MSGIFKKSSDPRTKQNKNKVMRNVDISCLMQVQNKPYFKSTTKIITE